MATTYPARGAGFSSLLVTVYLVVGGIVSATHHYWSNVHGWKAVVSGILAVVLWPLLFAGVNLHVH
jgi:hypothetical protein